MSEHIGYFQSVSGDVEYSLDDSQAVAGTC